MKNYGETNCQWCEKAFIKTMHNKTYCDTSIHELICANCSTVEFFKGRPQRKRHNKETPLCKECSIVESKKASRATKLEKYGDPFFNNKAKREETMIQRYGAKTSLESETLKEKIETTMINRYGGKTTKQSSATFKNSAMRRSNATGTTFEKSLELTMLLSDKNSMVKWLDNFLSIINRTKTTYGAIAEHFGTTEIELSHWFSKHPELKKKYIRIRSSFLEEKVSFYIEKIVPNQNILRRNKILNGYEIDIYLPEQRIGFEINDTSTHSKTSNDEPIDMRFSTLKRKYKFGPDYHNMKKEIAASKNIELLFLWEDEIRNDNFKEKVYNVLYN